MLLIRQVPAAWLAIALCAAGISSAEPLQKKVAQESAPYFILPTWDGQVIKSTSLKGKVVLMAFFQTWCPDCQRTNPLLEKLYRKYKDRGFVVLGISHDRGKAKDVEPYIKKYGLTYPIVLGDISIAVNYLRVSPQQPNFSIPYLVLVDRKGNIVGRFVEGRNEGNPRSEETGRSHHSAALAGTAGSAEVLKKEGPTLIRC